MNGAAPWKQSPLNKALAGLCRREIILPSFSYYSLFLLLFPSITFFVDVIWADYATAVEELLKVIHRYPQSSWAPDAFERIGIYCWQGLGEPEKAIEAYRKLIEKNPDDNLVPYAHFWLGTIYLQQEKTDLAKKEFLLVKQQWPMLKLAERSIHQLTQLAHQQKNDSPKKSGTIKGAK